MLLEKEYEEDWKVERLLDIFEKALIALGFAMWNFGTCTWDIEEIRCFLSVEWKNGGGQGIDVGLKFVCLVGDVNDVIQTSVRGT